MWDDVYQSDQPPPWDIGEPQPALAPLLANAVSDVLDAGCGTGALALALAAQGHTVVGMDISGVAVAKAADAAAQQSLTTATFVQADLTTLTGYDGRFSTIYDSGCLSSLPEPDQRPDYMAALTKAAAPGASLYILARDEHSGSVTEDELLQVVLDAGAWTITSFTTANVRCNAGLAQLTGAFTNAIPNGDGFDVSGHLLSATKGN